MSEGIAELRDRIAALERLAYIGEHRFPDQTWRARCEEVVQERNAAQQHVTDLEKSLEQARKERDEHLATLRGIASSLGFTGPGEDLPEAAQHVREQRDAALADNAELARFVADVATPVHAMDATVTHWTRLERRADALTRQPHPGAALLERVKRLEEHGARARQEGRDDGLESLAVWAEDRPRGCTNRDCKACTEARVIADMARAMKGGKTPEEVLADLY